MLAKLCLVVTDGRDQPASQQPAASSQQPGLRGAGGRGEAFRYPHIHISIDFLITAYK